MIVFIAELHVKGVEPCSNSPPPFSPYPKERSAYPTHTPVPFWLFSDCLVLAWPQRLSNVAVQVDVVAVMVEAVVVLLP